MYKILVVDIIIMDIMMPELDGLRYTKLIQQEGYKIIFEYDSSAEVLGDELKIS